jgi:hypothetical protein
MPGLDTASRVYPTYSEPILPNSGKPEFGGIYNAERRLSALRKADFSARLHGLHRNSGSPELRTKIVLEVG